jgi:hypothetical protein
MPVPNYACCASGLRKSSSCSSGSTWSGGGRRPRRAQSASPGSLRSPSCRTSSLRYGTSSYSDNHCLVHCRLTEESELPDFLTQVAHHIVTIAVLYTVPERKSRLIEESELPNFLTQVPHHIVTIPVLMLWDQSTSPGSLRSPSSRTSSLRYLIIQ